jgi:hypothetical protein
MFQKIRPHRNGGRFLARREHQRNCWFIRSISKKAPKELSCYKSVAMIEMITLFFTRKKVSKILPHRMWEDSLQGENTSASPDSSVVSMNVLTHLHNIT